MDKHEKGASNSKAKKPEKHELKEDIPIVKEANAAEKTEDNNENGHFLGKKRTTEEPEE